jgi:hypothetical protein
VKINELRLNGLHNDAHFQFFTEIRDLVTETTAAALKIEAGWPAFLTAFANYDEALRKIIKSAISDKIRIADKNRDESYSAFVKFLAAMCEHYDPAIRDAALKIQVVTHTYGNVAVKPINEETSAIYNLVQELRSDKYKDLATLIGLTPWLNKLDTDNQNFESLIQERDRESAAKSHLAIRDTRHAIDEIYRHIVNTINANLFFKQLTNQTAFVDTLNAIIHRFAVKHRKHKGDKDGESGQT